jgi:hypothetical protein
MATAKVRRGTAVKKLYLVICEDEAGDRHAVVVWLKRGMFWWLRSRDKPERGVTYYTLIDGSPVEFVDDHTFEIVDSGKLITRCKD